MIFKKIGIFDSGVGGLSLVKELITIPGLELVYYADIAHVPYGNRTKEEIQQFSSSAVQFLMNRHVDAIIIACHTAASNALGYLQEKFPSIPFIDVVTLIIDQAIMSSPKKIGILGTHATIASGIHKKFLTKIIPTTEIITQECPLLASAIEHNFNNKSYLYDLIKGYCAPLVDANVDTILLACTHYALIQPLIKQQFNSPINLISAEQNLQKKLTPFISSNLKNIATIEWFSSGNNADFASKATMILRPYDIET